MLKAKILAALKTKYKNLGLSEKVLDGIADMLAVTTTEEENIETAVSGVEVLLKTFQSDADTRVTTAVNKAKEVKVDPPAPAPAPTPADPAKVEVPGVPDFAKLLQDALSPIVKEITDLKTGNVTKSRQQTLEDKLKDANPLYKASSLKAFKRMSFSTDEEFNEYLAEVDTDLAEQKQAETNDQLKDIGAPFGGSNTVKEKDVSPFMKEIIADRATAAKAAGTN